MKTKFCSVCHALKPLAAFTHDRTSRNGRHHRCLACDRTRTRERRRNKTVNRSIERWRKGNPRAVEAHRLVQQAVRGGELQRQPCRLCGSARTHAHHDDYARPLAVEWLCHACHMEHHRLERLYTPDQGLFSFLMEDHGR